METHLVRVGFCEFDELVETELECMECGCKFTAEDVYDYCPECGSNDIELGESWYSGR